MAHVIVIGSGFGGSIAAKRFTEAGHTVELLELGEDWNATAPEGVPQSQDPRFIFRLLRDYPIDYQRHKPKLLVAQGMGLGGGSLVYSAIHLRAPATAFEGWPEGWTRPALDPYYERGGARPGRAPAARPAGFSAEGGVARGRAVPRPNPRAWAGCTAGGWGGPIGNSGKKTTMAHTYLADAARTGRLTVRTRRKAAYIARHGARYRVVYWRTDGEGVTKEYHRVKGGAEHYTEGDLVVVAGGAIESPALLLRSRLADVPRGWSRLNAFPDARLGRGIDGTGDFVQGGFVPQVVDGFKGSVMMMHIDMGDFVLEDVHGMPVGPTVMMDIRPAGTRKTWGLAYKERLRDLGRHMLGIAIIGKQGEGTANNIEVRDVGGNADVSGTAYAPPPGSIEAARAIIKGLGGEVTDSPWEIDRTAFTVHPVGGCAMGGADAVVSARDLGLQGNPGVYVIDGSVLPGSPLRNPSHTIAAVAERALDTIVAA